ncbi:MULTISPECIES: hypothetical protein [Subtercola]|uniref:hypothetical protein n=1 Tax=Subtercola TaxID=120212 RepID=UPI001375E569|nr:MULTISPECIES: hypothetical protein [Subtercola]MEA9986192.1 hypothetical protein [Subtercola sp. RTI3]
MSYTPPPLEPNEPGDPKKPSTSRIAIWIGVAAVGAYFLINGIVGIISANH